MVSSTHIEKYSNNEAVIGNKDVSQKQQMQDTAMRFRRWKLQNLWHYIRITDVELKLE